MDVLVENKGGGKMMDMPEVEMTHEELVKYDRAWSDKEVERIQQMLADGITPESKPKKKTVEDAVKELSDDIQHVRVRHLPYGKIYVYIKTKYLDGVPVPDLCQWLKKEIQENLVYAFYEIVDVLPMIEWHKLMSEQGQEAERRR